MAVLAAALPFLYLGPAAAVPALAQDSSALVGHVTSHDTHDPISGARVTVSSLGFAATTDSSGRFAITGLSAGVFVIEIAAIGYAKGSWRISLTPGLVLNHRFDLDPLPFELPEIVVKGKQSPSVRHFADFERRRQAGIGAFMVRSPPGCYPQYYLDGQESTAYFARHTPPHDVRGVEIYRGASETPGEFQNSNSGCGVIAIWTKSAP